VEDATLSVVIKAAYRALYEAKAGGGNVVKRATVTVQSFRRSFGQSASVTTRTGYTISK
jgi:hypothetical protein